MANEFSENAALGAALASIELQKMTVKLLMLHGVLPKDLTLRFIDLTLQEIETKAAALANHEGKPSLALPMHAARFHIVSLLTELQMLDIPQSDHPTS